MTDLGGGVFLEPPDDAWEDVGYEPHEHGPAPAQGALPTCPWCDHQGPHTANEGRLGGILCGACGNHFTSAPGEHAAMAGKRRLWSEETGVSREHRP